MTTEQQFIDQFEDEISELDPSIEQSILHTLFYITILPRIKAYLNNRSVVFVGATGPSIYIVLQQEYNLDIHFEIFPDKTAVYSIFVGEDMIESDEGTVEQCISSVIENTLEKKEVTLSVTPEDIQKAMLWAEENMKI